LIRKTLLVVCCLGFAQAGSAFAAASPASKAAGAQEELSDLKSRIEAIQKRIAAAEENRTEAVDALRASERSISDARRAMAELSEQSRSAAAKVVELGREVERLRTGVDEQRTKLAERVYRQYVAGHPGTMAVLLSGRDPNTIARDLHYQSYIVRARAALITTMGDDLARAQALVTEAEGKAAELAAAKAEQMRERTRLEKEQRARAIVLTRISRDIEQQQREFGTLKRDETRLSTLVDQLSRVIARTPKPRTEAHARLAPRIASEPVTDAPAEDESFARLKGRLALPVRGELASRFGSPRQDSGIVWKGVFIAAPGGEEVRAVGAGRVVFADWLRGFGNLLIIDHGESYMTLYGYNEALLKQVGDVIHRGERIATVGSTGGRPDSGLYFEMRHEGRPFDPMSWVPRR
jgi:septal ring factor EnvC (AmiA/AmiB activator)